MRFMILVNASTQPEDGTMPEEKFIAAMAEYHDQLAKAGVLLDASVLQPTSKGWRVRYSDGKRSVIDGPFAEDREPVAGYTIIQVRSREEALEWGRRFPAPNDDDAEVEIEVRRTAELDVVARSDAIEQFRAIGTGGAGQAAH